MIARQKLYRGTVQFFSNSLIKTANKKQASVTSRQKGVSHRHTANFTRPLPSLQHLDCLLRKITDLDETYLRVRISKKLLFYLFPMGKEKIVTRATRGSLELSWLSPEQDCCLAIGRCALGVGMTVDKRVSRLGSISTDRGVPWAWCLEDIFRVLGKG